MNSKIIRISEKNYLRLQKIAKALGPPPKQFRWSPDEVLSLVLDEVERQQSGAGTGNRTKARKRLREEDK